MQPKQAASILGDQYLPCAAQQQFSPRLWKAVFRQQQVHTVDLFSRKGVKSKRVTDFQGPEQGDDAEKQRAWIKRRNRSLGVLLSFLRNEVTELCLSFPMERSFQKATFLLI